MVLSHEHCKTKASRGVGVSACAPVQEQPANDGTRPRCAPRSAARRRPPVCPSQALTLRVLARLSFLPVPPPHVDTHGVGSSCPRPSPGDTGQASASQRRGHSGAGTGRGVGAARPSPAGQRPTQAATAKGAWGAGEGGTGSRGCPEGRKRNKARNSVRSGNWTLRGEGAASEQQEPEPELTRGGVGALGVGAPRGSGDSRPAGRVREGACDPH